MTIAEGTPVPKGFNQITFPDPVCCSLVSTGIGWPILQEFSVAADGGLKDMVVLLVDAKKGNPFPFEPPTIEAGDCRFIPFCQRGQRSEVQV